MSERRTDLSGEDIADAKNGRGFNIPWPKLAGHYGLTVAELQAAMGEPQWKPEPAAADNGTDLWRNTEAVL